MQAETALVTTLLLDTGLPAPRDVAAAVYERTDGIPLHIEELLGALSAEARVDGTAIREADVPDTIEDAVLARLAQPVARGAGDRTRRRGHRPLLRARCPGRDHGRAARARSRRRSRSSSTSSSSTRPAFAACTTSGTSSCATRCTGTIPASDRRRFHARAGEFGARLEGASEIHASVHYERAGLRREAFEAALAGAREAARLSARREAFELYRRAVENMPDDLDPAERAAILTRLRRAGGCRSRSTTSAVWAAERCGRASIGELGRPAQAISGARRLIWTICAPRGATAGRAPGDAARALGGARPVSTTIPTCWKPAPWSRMVLAIDALDARDVPEARQAGDDARGHRRRARRSDEWRMVAEWKDGPGRRRSMATCRAAWPASAMLAYEAERRGLGRHRRDRVPGSVVGRGRPPSTTARRSTGSMRAFATAIRSSSRIARMSCARPWPWCRGRAPIRRDAQSRARQAIVDKGCRARRHDRPLGARATWR